MARNQPPRTATVRVPLADDDGGAVYEAETLTEAEAAADQVQRETSDDILKALTEIEGAAEVRWQVWRVLPSERQGFVTELMTAELNAATIKKRCGPGKYQIRGTHPDGRYAGRRMMWVADDGSTPGTALVPASSGANDILAFIEKQKLQSKEDLKFWLGLLVPILGPALIEMFKRKDTSMTDLVAALRGLKEVSGDGGAAAKLGELRDLIGVVKDLMPEGGASTGSTWPDLVREGLKALPSVAPALAAMRPAPTPQLPPGARLVPPGAPIGGGFIPPVAPPPPAVPGPNDPTPQPQEQPMLGLFQWLQMQLPILAEKAKANADAQQYAESLADLMPPGVDPLALRDWLIRNDWWQMLSGFYPPIAPYQMWFTQLRGRLLEMIDEAIADAQQPEGASLEEMQANAGPIQND